MWGVDFFQDPYDFHMGLKRKIELDDNFKGEIRVIFMGLLMKSPYLGKF